MNKTLSSALLDVQRASPWIVNTDLCLLIKLDEGFSSTTPFKDGKILFSYSPSDSERGRRLFSALRQGESISRAFKFTGEEAAEFTKRLITSSDHFTIETRLGKAVVITTFLSFSEYSVILFPEPVTASLLCCTDNMDRDSSFLMDLNSALLSPLPRGAIVCSYTDALICIEAVAKLFEISFLVSPVGEETLFIDTAYYAFSVFLLAFTVLRHGSKEASISFSGSSAILCDITLSEKFNADMIENDLIVQDICRITNSVPTIEIIDDGKSSQAIRVEIILDKKDPSLLGLKLPDEE